MTRWLVGGIAALPGVIAGLITGASGVATLVAGRPLILAPAPTSLAEAARYADAAEVALRVSLGEDVNRATRVRIPGERSLILTPLEAAAASGRNYMVTLVIDSGARLDDQTLRRLRCLVERDHVGGGMKDYLSTLDPSPLSCNGVPVPE